MCQFFDKAAYNECREPMANRILEKETANFCDYFKVGGAGKAGNDKDQLVDAANSLFKN
jgi:protein-tyrosine-phosphatase